MVDEKPSLGRYNFDIENIEVLWEQLKDKVETFNRFLILLMERENLQ